MEAACEMLEKADGWEEPHKLFGYKDVNHISAIFSLGHRYKHDKRVANDLDKLVHEAAKTIREAFHTCGIKYVSDNPNAVYRRCEYNPEFSDFTHLATDETKIPSAEEEGWAGVQKPPQVNMAQATNETLKIFGFAGEEFEDNGEGAEETE